MSHARCWFCRSPAHARCDEAPTASRPADTVLAFAGSLIAYLLILAFIFLYKLGDSMATALATPFYLDMGFTKTEMNDLDILVPHARHRGRQQEATCREHPAAGREPHRHFWPFDGRPWRLDAGAAAP